MDPLRFLRPDFADLPAYAPVKPLEVLAAEIGVPPESLVKLDANENLYGPPPEVREAVARADLHIYPDPGQTALRAAIGEYLGVSPDQIVAGAGSDDLIDILVRLTEPRAAVTATPTFAMYGFLSRIDGVACVEVPRDDRFAVDLDGIRHAVDQGARLVFLASPNNPTGNGLTLDEVEALCGLDALVVVDEAYAEFAGSSALPLLEKQANLVVLRTFSKWAGLAGLRVGYGVCHPEIAKRMMAIKQPYNVNAAGDVAARAALETRATIFETVSMIVAERDRIAREVGALGWLDPYPSEANFVLFRVGGGACAAEIAAALRARGVLVRHYDRAELAGTIRISAGRPQDTDRLLVALKEVGPR